MFVICDATNLYRIHLLVPSERHKQTSSKGLQLKLTDVSIFESPMHVTLSAKEAKDTASKDQDNRVMILASLPILTKHERWPPAERFSRSRA